MWTFIKDHSLNNPKITTLKKESEGEEMAKLNQAIRQRAINKDHFVISWDILADSSCALVSIFLQVVSLLQILSTNDWNDWIFASSDFFSASQHSNSFSTNSMTSLFLSFFLFYHARLFKNLSCLKYLFQSQEKPLNVHFHTFHLVYKSNYVMQLIFCDFMENLVFQF